VESETLQAPPVVAVVIVHEPGSWFEDTLAAFAAQDYPNLRFLFVDTGDPAGHAALSERIQAVVPSAFVRPLGANPGFGPAVNEATRLVEGNGLFWICHDDIAPERTALRSLVEELYRSNAGVVGPKFVEWDRPEVLQAVGLGLDRFGEVDEVIEPGEVDQEQHDGVRDVFALPSASLLIRADLFREIGGFDPAIDFFGDDIELCWRVHHSGARVVVVPSARVRHVGTLEERRPDLRRRVLAARHRMRTVATMTGGSRLLGRSIELVLLTAAELLVGLFTGRFGEAWASLRGLVGLVPRTPGIVKRRRVVRPLRHVPEREVAGLQARGSARLNAFLRSRQTATYVGAGHAVRRWRESTSAPVIAWLVVLAALIIGSREMILHGIPTVGEFLPFPESPRSLLDSFLSGFDPNGLGATSPNPSGWATLSGLSVATLFRMGLLQTVFTIGLVVVGLIGIWRLAAVFPSTRARVGVLLVYAASPLVAGAMSTGKTTVLVVYASTPWIVHLFRRAVGVGTADPRMAEMDVPDGLLHLTPMETIRRSVTAGLAIALGAAFAPVVLVLAGLLALALCVGTLLALAPWRTALAYLGVGVVACAVGAALNLPWIASWTWEGIVGPPPIGDPHDSLLAIASFDIGLAEFTALSLALYLPVVASMALARAWRLTWAVRAGVLVAGFGALAVLGDRGSLPIQPPTPGVLLVPVAVGVAIAAGAALAAFDLDVRGGSFGWRQPLGILASVAVAVGIVPGVLAIGAGDWDAPETSLSSIVEASLPPAEEAGDYNVLLVGDARILPVPSTEYRDGLAWAVAGAGGFDVRSTWAAPTVDAGQSIDVALDQIASGSTLRAGRLLAPWSIRYIVIPELDGVVSTSEDRLPEPAGLYESLGDQLDLVSLTGLPTIQVFENRAWIPHAALLEGATAEASAEAGADALVRADLSDATAAFPGLDQLEGVSQDVPAGVVALAVPFDDNWKLSVDGVDAPARRAFGLTTAFDVENGGAATLAYESPASRALLVVLQVALWLLAFFVATRVRVSIGRRTESDLDDETLIHLDEEPPAPPVAPAVAPVGIDPGLDITGELSRSALAAEAAAERHDSGEVEIVPDVEVGAVDDDGEAAPLPPPSVPIEEEGR
jgi:GT2 family glycosyltransferase